MKCQFGGEVFATQYQDMKSSDICEQNIKSHSLQESIWSKPAGELIQDRICKAFARVSLSHDHCASLASGLLSISWAEVAPHLGKVKCEAQ